MRPGLQRASARRYPISCLFAQADDMTSYARTLGCRGSRSVYVLDGKVISHRSINWFDFCAALRSRKSRQERKLS